MNGWVKRKVAATAAIALDRAVVVAMQLRGARDAARAEVLPHDERMRKLAEIEAAYSRPEHFDDPDSFFAPPRPIDPRLTRARGGVFDAEWPSEFVPFLAALEGRYLSRVHNRTARARLYLGERPRPAIVLVHGYMGGQWVIEERQWPILPLFRRGLDVALPVLPFHALRSESSAPIFPSADPRFTNEGFRQAVHDLRALVRWLRARGAPHVSVMGMSLGGYTTALLATIERDLDFVVPMIPLASIADFAREQGRLGSVREAELQHEALERANWVVSPIARPPLVPPERALVIAAEHDRITPIGHAQRIASHLQGELIIIPGGHLLQLGRREGFRAVVKRLEGLGAIAPRPPR